MRCPKCGADNDKVVDSRPAENNDSIRRRRECNECGFRFTTYERCEELPLVVIKSDGTKEPFDREKLMRGLVRATVKRNVDISQLDQLIGSIESELHDKSISEIESKKLGEMVLQRMLILDKVAYVRFASVYRDFKDIDEFSDELRRLSNGQN